MVAPVNQKNFEALAITVGHPEWNDDPRFATIGGREHNWSLLMQQVEEWSMQRSASECEAVLMRAGVPCSRYKTMRDLLAEPDMTERGTFEEIADGSGRFLIPRQPFVFSDARVAAPPYVSDLGEDTTPVLRDMLGMTVQDIADLRLRHVII
jgi:crotonobetainyl-CoA:carnitine CoA-transferase CaiB-like acyl-CoA transferase